MHNSILSIYRIDLIDYFSIFSLTYFSFISVCIRAAGASGLPRSESRKMEPPDRLLCRVLKTQSWRNQSR